MWNPQARTYILEETIMARWGYLESSVWLVSLHKELSYRHTEGQLYEDIARMLSKNQKPRHRP